jgi:hypothetical protein
MNISTTYHTERAETSKSQGAATDFKQAILKIVKALSFDAEPIFKSKDWPFLWPK